MTPWYAECVTTVSLFILSDASSLPSGRLAFVLGMSHPCPRDVSSLFSGGLDQVCLNPKSLFGFKGILLQAECHIGRQVQNAVLVLKVFGMDNVTPPYALAVFLPESVQGQSGIPFA